MQGLALGVCCWLVLLFNEKLLSGIWPQEPWGPHCGGGTWLFVICSCLCEHGPGEETPGGAQHL